MKNTCIWGGGCGGVWGVVCDRRWGTGVKNSHGSQLSLIKFYILPLIFSIINSMCSLCYPLLSTLLSKEVNCWKSSMQSLRSNILNTLNIPLIATWGALPWSLEQPKYNSGKTDFHSNKDQILWYWRDHYMQVVLFLISEISPFKRR